VPFNLTSPNTANFNVQFTDTSGNPTFPTSADITFTYLFGGVLVSSTSDLTAAAGGFWTKGWSSLGVDVPSNVYWSIVSSL
jgi:hypothetical protein